MDFSREVDLCQYFGHDSGKYGDACITGTVKYF